MALPGYIVTSSSPVSDVADATELASTAAGKGASLIGIEDAGLKYTGTTVEAALTELADGTVLDAQYVQKSGDTMTGDLNIDSDSKALILGDGQDMSVYYDGTQGQIKTDLVGASDLHVSCGTDKTVVLDEVVWDDLRVVPGSIDRPGVSDPTYQDWQPGGSGTTFKVLKFDAGQYAFFTVQLPHSYKAGENIFAHVHWTPGRGTTEGTATVAWKIDYSWASIESVFGASATADCTDACQSTNDEHLMSPEATITGSGKGISSMLVCKIYRDAGDSWAGTGANGPAILEVDFHYPIDTIGSRQVGAK